jgi:hypothetical protein
MKALISILGTFLIVVLTISLSSAETTIHKKKTDEEHAQSLLKWLNEEGGYFNPKVEMRRLDPSDPSSVFGMFVNENVSNEELLFRIPRNMILNSGDETHPIIAGTINSPLTCSTARNLAEQLRLKDESKYAPYVNYLLDTQSPDTIPSAWSDSAQSLFERVLGNSEEDIDVLQLLGGDPFLWLEEWYESCNGSDDPIDEYAALLVIQRSWDDMLIPILDMMSHRNGKWWNIKYSDVYDDSQDIEVRARRDIQKGEQLYSTYNKCDSCGRRTNMFGTPDILRDYGFVEQMPQSYFLYPLHFGFRLDYKDYDENGEPVGDVVVTEWINTAPHADDIELFRDIVLQVKEKKKTILSVRDENVSDFEWNTIHAYADALEVAFEAAANSSIPVIVDPYSGYDEGEYFDWIKMLITEDDDDEFDEVDEHGYHYDEL